MTSHIHCGEVSDFDTFEDMNFFLVNFTKNLHVEENVVGIFLECACICSICGKVSGS